jgi:sugar fermentation stimulation protein A
MKYNDIYKAKFIERPNRFIAKCLLDERVEVVHVKNTGRCKELLVAGATVYLEKSSNPNRKTLYDLVAVEKSDTLINMDSQAPNKVAYEWLQQGHFVPNPTLVKPEVKFGNSRFDFYVESESEKAFVEVKGVTLESDGIACFPDAPTQRGTKHLNELILAKQQGFKTAVLFVIQMKGCTKFIPNDVTDKNFANALRLARAKDVEIIAVDCVVTPESMKIDKKIAIQL